MDRLWSSRASSFLPNDWQGVENSFDIGVAYLAAAGAHNVVHSSRTLADHLLGTHALLSHWDQAEEVCIAGLLHSVYGTASGLRLLREIPRRAELCRLFGPRVERLVYGYHQYRVASQKFSTTEYADLRANLELIFLANLVDQTIFLPRYLLGTLENFLGEMTCSLPKRVADWMDEFLGMVRDIQSLKNAEK